MRNTKNRIFLIFALGFVLGFSIVLSACTPKKLPEEYDIYTIIFNSTGGSYVAPGTSNVKTGKVTQPSNPIKDGYVFYNWYETNLKDESGWHYDYIEKYGWDDWYGKYAFNDECTSFNFDKYWGNDRMVYAVWKPAPVDILILTIPTASNVQMGESTLKSRLTGEFNVSGELHFIGEPKTLNTKGTVICDWEFVPTDLEFYNVIIGTVTVRFCEYKIQFETNGGFDPSDICFDGSYVIEKKILTAKNEYRFEGWSEADGSDLYIEYPYTVTSSKTLYAGYRFHTAEKLNYVISKTYNYGQVTQKTTCDYYPFFINTPNHVDGSIDGEIIIADMYDDIFIRNIGNFRCSGITKVIFNNYVEKIEDMAFYSCLSLAEIVIPNTIKHIGDGAFSVCYSLERIEFEDGCGGIEILRNAFRYCERLTDVILHRVQNIGYGQFANCNSLEHIIIPKEVKKIDDFAFAFCNILNQVIIEGENLERVGNRAFAGCQDLEEITFPAVTHISPDTFWDTPIQKINITDEQINWIAQELHEVYIGVSDNFTINITRDIQYGGLHFESEYTANSETINLRFEYFSINVLDALIYEFFHHYQYVLIEGVGEERLNTVFVFVDKYGYINGGLWFGVPIIIVKNDMKYWEYLWKYIYNEDEIYWEYLEKTDEYAYEHLIFDCERYGYEYILIEETTLSEWSQPYISLLPDESNWEEYWNQPFEAHPREFASWFTGVQWEE
jgi:hypothetical protein